MRECNKCKEVKPLDEFRYRSGIHSHLKRHECKSCESNAANEYAKRNRAYVSDTNLIRRRNKKQECVDYLGGKCAHCGGEFITHVFDFHHKDPSQKDSDIGSMLRLNKSKNDLIHELDKCILLCANCHRIEHYKESDGNIAKINLVRERPNKLSVKEIIDIRDKYCKDSNMYVLAEQYKVSVATICNIINKKKAYKEAA